MTFVDILKVAGILTWILGGIKIVDMILPDPFK